MKESLGEKIAAAIEQAAEDIRLRRISPTQEFSDVLRELRQQLGMSVQEFCDTYGVATEEVHIAEFARGVKPSTSLLLLVAMIKYDSKKTAEVIANAKKGNS